MTWLLSADLRLLLHGLQMLHVHVLLAAPLGSGYMTKPCADQHQGRVSVRKCSDHPCPAPNLTVHPLDYIVGSDAQKSSDMFAKCQYLDEITGGKGVTFATGTPVSNSILIDGIVNFGIFIISISLS